MPIIDPEDFIKEMRRYLKSGNDVPVAQVTIKAEELEQILNIADDYIARYENSGYDDYHRD